MPVLCKNFLLVLHSYSCKTINTSYICVCMALFECVFNFKISPVILNYLYEVKTMKLLLHMIHSAPLVKQQCEHLLNLRILLISSVQYHQGSHPTIVFFSISIIHYHSIEEKKNNNNKIIP